MVGKNRAGAYPTTNSAVRYDILPYQLNTSLASSSAEEPSKLDIRGSSVESKVLFLRLSWKDMMG